MSEILAQATPGNSSSNASDFQPTTQNPQSSSTNVFQPQVLSQNVINPQELLNEQKNAIIVVANNPVPAQTQAKPEGNATGLVLLSLVTLLLVVAFYKIYKNLQAKSKITSDKSAEVEKSTSEKESSSAPKPKKKYKTSKKKTSKKSARKHR